MPALPASSFYRGIPGCVGGALRMNGGAHGRETCEVLVEARAVDRAGQRRMCSRGGAALRTIAIAARRRISSSPRRCSRASLASLPRSSPRWTTSPAYREQAQPIKSRTGGSTFKNPPGHKAWQLIDAAGCRGLRVGGAHGLGDALQLPHQ